MANKFEYEVKDGKVKGYFNIYQAKNGYIILQLGDSFTKLTNEQIDELEIDVYDLKDFNIDDFNNAYFTY